MRVVIGEDQALLREGIGRLLEEAGFDVVGKAGDAVDLRRKVGAHKPDVALVDIRMPPTHTDDGLRAAIQIRSEHPATRVLVLSQYVEERYAIDLIGGCAEGVGYLLKDRVGDLDEFAEAVRRVGEGGSVLDPEVVTRMLARTREADPVEDLSPRERDVLELMAQGRSNHGIAEKLWITESAVEKHVTAIFEKLNLEREFEGNRRVLAVLTFLRGA
jgi:DNA-binding NarL/FixJ family response regulator